MKHKNLEDSSALYDSTSGSEDYYVPNPTESDTDSDASLKDKNHLKPPSLDCILDVSLPDSSPACDSTSDRVTFDRQKAVVDSVVSNRNWQSVKFFVYNRITKNKRQLQHK